MPSQDQPPDLDDDPFPPAPAETTDPRIEEVWSDDLAGSDGVSTVPVGDEGVRSHGRSRFLLIVLGIVIVAMAGVVVFLAMNSRDDGTRDQGAAPPADAGPLPPPETVPDPGSDPELAAPATLSDDFDRPDGPLGAYPGLDPWVDRAGTVVIDGGVARTGDVDKSATVQLTTVDAGTSDLVAEVRLPSPVDRGGLAIRVESPDRFLGLYATGDYGTYTLVRVENGKVSKDDVIGNTGLTGVRPNDVIGIRAVGSKVDILTNGTVRASFDDPKTEIAGTGVGLFVIRDETGPEPIDAREFANWDDFKILRR